MKRLKPVTAAATALLLTIASASPIYADTAAATDTETAEVNAVSGAFSGYAVTDVDTYCNVRSDASTDAEIVGVFYPGCVAEVEGEKDGWTLIGSGSVEGYIRSDLLVTGSDVDSLLGQNNFTSYAQVTAPVLNVRSGAGLDQTIIGAYGQGQDIEILGSENGWYKVNYEGVTGYVSSDWVKAGDGVHTAMTNDEYTAWLNGGSSTDAASSADSTDGAESQQADTAQQADAAQQTDAAQQAADTSAADSTAQTAVSADSSDLNLLAALIYCEAGNQVYDGKVAVGAVVMNRVNSASYPGSIHDVIYQSGQFTPASSGALARALSSGVPDSCYQAAQDALNGVDPTGGLLHFHAGSGSGLTIDGQTFY
ncbi:MAG: SH3 domain-containing protein [Eubacteriales bacterium]|jgi:spore germination cell wall hydrolase CwlJ-like protein